MHLCTVSCELLRCSVQILAALHTLGQPLQVLEIHVLAGILQILRTPASIWGLPAAAPAMCFDQHMVASCMRVSYCCVLRSRHSTEGASSLTCQTLSQLGLGQMRDPAGIAWQLRCIVQQPADVDLLSTYGRQGHATESWLA